MARLFRPHIPLAVRVQVAERQLKEKLGRLPPRMTPSNGAWLAVLLGLLAPTMGCEVADLRLDHDPPLGAREKHGEGKRTVYSPAANDPEYLAYRPHGAQYAGSHDVKTRIRGDHGQYSDIQLIKRERRRQRKADGRPKKKWATRSNLSTKGARFPKRKFPKKRKR